MQFSLSRAPVFSLSRAPISVVALAGAWVAFLILLAGLTIYALFGPKPVQPNTVSFALPEPSATVEASSGDPEDRSVPPVADLSSLTAPTRTQAESVEVDIPPPTESSEPALARHSAPKTAKTVQPAILGSEPGQSDSGDAIPPEIPAGESAPSLPSNASPLPVPTEFEGTATENGLGTDPAPEQNRQPLSLLPPQQLETTGAEASTAKEPDASITATDTTVEIAALSPLEQNTGPAWEIYRSPFDASDLRPRIAVVISGLGLDPKATVRAIELLPAQITLSFSPYASELGRVMTAARAAGHELMLDLPMEPYGFPAEDPGPQALLTSLDKETNLERLNWALGRGHQYVGLTAVMGSRFSASPSHMRPVLAILKEKGLIYLDNMALRSVVAANIARELEVPLALNTRALDDRETSLAAIDARLAQVERVALTNGFAVAIGQPYPMTLSRVASWVEEVAQRGFVLAPISAVANRQSLP